MADAVIIGFIPADVAHEFTLHFVVNLRRTAVIRKSVSERMEEHPLVGNSAYRAAVLAKPFAPLGRQSAIGRCP